MTAMTRAEREERRSARNVRKLTEQRWAAAAPVTDAEMHALNDDQARSILWYLRGYLKDSPQFKEALRTAHDANVAKP